MGRLNAELTAMSQISGSVDCSSCAPASHEKLRRNRRHRKTNSPTYETTGDRPTSYERFSRSDALKRHAPSSPMCRTSSSSPSNSESQSPGRMGAYAGAKFGEAPSPRLLPPPPQHWLSGNNVESSMLSPCHDLTDEIKTLLHIA